MAGAYVAKPAVVPDPGVPPGWPWPPWEGWPWPGASPPGYEISPELRLTTGATYVPETTHSATTKIVDRKAGADWKTREPNSESQVAYSATMDGVPLILLGEDEQVGTTIYYSWDAETIGGWWTQALMLAFPTVDRHDAEKIISLVAATIEPFGEVPWAGFEARVAANIEVRTCEVDLDYEQDVKDDFSLLEEYCFDYVTDGMLVFQEITGTYEGGFEDYVDTQIAEKCNVPRFWMWTQYPEVGTFLWSSVGIIDKEGVMQAPFAHYGYGGWTEGQLDWPDDEENWWLIQLVQEDREDEEELTVTKPLTGTLHGQAYHHTWERVCILTKGDGDCPYGLDSRSWVVTYTYYNSCNDETTVTVTEVGPLCPGELGRPSGCSDTENVTTSGDDEGDAWDDEISQGEDFFKTWDYYVEELE